MFLATHGNGSSNLGYPTDTGSRLSDGQKKIAALFLPLEIQQNSVLADSFLRQMEKPTPPLQGRVMSRAEAATVSASGLFGETVTKPRTFLETIQTARKLFSSKI
jgi:hypothetical protein